MNNVAIFSNSRFGDIRTIDEQGKVYFCGKDIATALGYTNTKDAVSRHCVPKGVVKHDLLTNGGKQRVNFIDEGNLYRLITHSKLPDAEKFESWVFDEVLPTIRKTGTYTVTNAADAFRLQSTHVSSQRAKRKNTHSATYVQDSREDQHKVQRGFAVENNTTLDR